MLTIAVCGNHQVVYCTESELAWSLEQMGHVVLRLQENRTSTEDMLRQCVNRDQKVDLFLYIHTHGWKTPGLLTFDELLQALRAEGVKSASFHLDRYWGIPEREARIGRHPFWRTDHVFTADGGNQIKFKERGVLHSWLPPAVAARHCVRGTPRPEYMCDIGFVGSQNYHAEYSFRWQLIAWLEQTYGHRFRRFNGDSTGTIREAKLNDLYASVKVLVGDSCFAGAPYYWSDRVPETLGRGGFLIHPETPGLEIPGLVTFPPGDLLELKHKIDYAVTRDVERQLFTDMAMDDVRLHHTYTQRMATLLKVMELI